MDIIKPRSESQALAFEGKEFGAELSNRPRDAIIKIGLKKYIIIK